MEKFNKKSEQKITEIRINTRLSASMGGGGVLGNNFNYLPKKLLNTAQHNQIKSKLKFELQGFFCISKPKGEIKKNIANSLRFFALKKCKLHKLHYTLIKRISPNRFNVLVTSPFETNLKGVVTC